jgi:hypothetical protein
MPFQPKIPCLFLWLAACLGVTLAHGQTNFNNPSFEGTAGAGIAPRGWTVCANSPDVQPGFFGVTRPAADGNTYVGLLTTTGAYRESIGQPFAFTAGVTYAFSLNLARSATYSGYGAAGRLNIWAGTANCAKSLLIWQSPVATDAWQTHTFNFVPGSDYTFIRLEAEYPGSAEQGSNVLVDNLQLSCGTTTAPTAAATGTLAAQANTWSMDQPLDLMTNIAVTGVPAAEVKWAIDYRRNGQTVFTRVIDNPTGYRFETPGVVLIRPTYFCGGNPVNFAAPVRVTINGGFNQKIDVNWPGAHEDIFVVCEVLVKRGGQTYFKGTTSGEGKFYAEGLQNGDIILVKSTKIIKPYAYATFTVNFSAEQATPVVINLTPNFVDVGL